MATISKRKSAHVPTRWRRPLSQSTLQMMVMSGVVRRADLNPPPAPHRHQPPDNRPGMFPQEAASEQGWLSRMFLGRKAQTPANHS